MPGPCSRWQNPLAESPGESVLRWIAVARGLPHPVLQCAIRTARRTVYSDLAWRFLVAGRPLEIHAEYDGMVKYGDDAADVVVAEKLREDAIRETGAVVLRFVSADLDRPSETFRRLCHRLPENYVLRLRRDPDLFG